MKQNLLFNRASAICKRLAMVLTMLLIVGIGQAWGETATFTASQSGGWTGTAGAQSGTIDGVTLAVTNGINNGSQLRCYANATMTISSTNNITKIVVTCTSTSNGPSNFLLSNSTGSYDGSGTIGTWEGGATSVSLKASAQVRMTQIVVTYTAAASCTTPPTVSSASNSNITSTTATVSCPSGITSLGSAGCSITSYGFVYGTSSNPTISNTKVQVGTTYTTTGTAFSKGLTGLTANTTYYVRPYATNGNGTAYGTQTSFKTAEIKYTVTYNANGATGTVPTDANEYVSGATVTAKSHGNLAKTGYSFSGWKRSDNSTIVQENATFTMPASNLTLTAQWQINTYTVTWIVDGVTKRTDTGVAYNTSKTAPTISPVPCGDVIAGWTDAVDGNYEHGTSTLHSGATPSITITSDKTFYAVFADYVTE